MSLLKDKLITDRKDLARFDRVLKGRIERIFLAIPDMQSRAEHTGRLHRHRVKVKISTLPATKYIFTVNIEMIDEEIDRLIAIGLESSRWATKALTISEKDSTPLINAVDKPKSADRIDSPISFPTQLVQEQSCTTPASEEPVVVDLCISQASSITSSTNMSHDAPTVIENTRTLTCPPELLAVVEAEKRCVAQTAAKIEACTVAINSVKTALATLATSSQNNFVVSFKSLP
ncbi:putative eka-like protein [Erysiphe necator]|uniref:Putative eka-like protein n=1 Tax=Uncinula necator TaxID=52586 RepID=A0A0B1P178_UNCNE|nr:putative eka-like protein [Erysiphe necator]